MKFWYSEKQKNVRRDNPDFVLKLKAFEIAHRLRPDTQTACFVTLPINGALVEVEYTEAYGGEDPNVKCNWDDAIFLGEGDESSIRIVEVDEAQRSQ